MSIGNYGTQALYANYNQATFISPNVWVLTKNIRLPSHFPTILPI